MGFELEITRELATTCATLTEISAIIRLVNNEIRGGEFNTRFNKIASDILMSYDVVTENLSPFVTLNKVDLFANKFDEYHAAYKDCYLKEISKPRISSDDAYEEHLILKTLKESKTSYPLLKRTFERLDQFIDKWMTNDYWLAMSIDNMFKRMHLLLNEIAQLKQKDVEDAFVIYDSAFSGFSYYLALIRQQRGLLNASEAA